MLDIIDKINGIIVNAGTRKEFAVVELTAHLKRQPPRYPVITQTW